jgi:hypothetical protein
MWLPIETFPHTGPTRLVCDRQSGAMYPAQWDASVGRIVIADVEPGFSPTDWHPTWHVGDRMPDPPPPRRNGPVDLAQD